MRQLDLFSDGMPPTTKWFPVRYRRRYIRNIARILLERDGQKRQKRWQLERTRLEVDFFLAGIDDDELIAGRMTGVAKGIRGGEEIATVKAVRCNA
jgi:hypothetical protein